MIDGEWKYINQDWSYSPLQNYQPSFIFEGILQLLCKNGGLPSLFFVCTTCLELIF